MPTYNMSYTITFVNEGEWTNGPEPYGWIKAYLFNPDHSFEIFQQDDWGSNTPERSEYTGTIKIMNDSPIKQMCFYGEVFDYDVGNADDQLCYSSDKRCGRPGETIKLNGDESGTYIKISYSVEPA